MARKSLITLFTGIFIIWAFIGCEKKYASSTEAEEDETDTIVDYNGDSSDTIFIVLDNTTITASSSSVTIDGAKATITKAGTYSVKGTLSNGQIVVNTTDEADVRIVLKGANITCSSSAPINIQDSEQTIIVLAENTTSYLTDGTTYTYDDVTEQEPNAVIFSKSDLAVIGNGSLVVDGNFNDGISGKDGVIIKGGSITVNAVDDGIRGKDYLIVRDGNFNITAGGKGLKSDNAVDTSLGYITIDTGYFNITSSGDAVAAETKVKINYAEMTLRAGGGSGTSSTTQGYNGSVSAKGIKASVSIVINDGIIGINSADDALHTASAVTINGGTINISTMDDAIHGEGSITVNKGTVNITKCYEGFEGPSINLAGGSVNLISTDDGINGTQGNAVEQDDGSMVTISEGIIVLNSSSGDPLDSNGRITMSGGTVIVHGPSSSPEVAIDVNGTFNINGGFLIASGPNSGNMIEATATSSAQNTVKITGSGSTAFSSSSLFHIQDGTNKDIVTFKPVRNAYYMVFSSSELINGSTYSIYTGGTYSTTSTTGFYSGGTYSGGTFKKSFTVSGKVTSVSL